MSEGQESMFYCCNHPSVVAVAFCETCSTMQGCSGYFCKECDDTIHKSFATHRRTEPRRSGVKICSKHPGHSTEEVFCWKTGTFYCGMCGCENKIDSEAVPAAIDKLIKTLGEDSVQLKNDIRKLSGRKNMISSELCGPQNPNSLEAQMREALGEIQTSFNRLKALLEQREKAFMEEIESKFNTKMEALEMELAEVSDAIEKGNWTLESYSAIATTSTGKDANHLKELLEMKRNRDRISEIAKKCETLPIIHVDTQVAFEDENRFREMVCSYGRVVETSNIPPPQDFRVNKTTATTAELGWSPLETSHKIAYRVMSKKADSPDGEWDQFYTGPETECVCTDLQPFTSYMFKIFAICDGIKSVYHNTCNGQTVNNLFEWTARTNFLKKIFNYSRFLFQKVYKALP